MRTMKKRIASLLAAIFCLTLLTLPAGAYVRVDTDAPVSLTLNYKSNGKAIEGLKVRLYKVYNMTDAVRFQPTQNFLDAYGPKAEGESGEFQFDVNAKDWQITDSSGKVQIDWNKMTTTLAGLIARDLASEDTAAKAPKPVAEGTSNSEGNVVFDTDQNTEERLTAGLYLVIGEPKVDGRYTYTPQTFMVALPLLSSDDSWNYHVTADEKLQTNYDPPDGGGGGTTTAITVNKVWDDADAEDVVRPESIRVQLLQNGNVYDTQTLSESNGWYYRWSGLSSSSHWQIAEVDVPDGYSVSVEQSNNSFIITNTADTEIEEPEIPEGPGPSTDPGDPTEPTDPGTDIPDVDIPGGPGDPGTDDPGIDIPDEGTPGGDLPQTGVLWWPVQALTLAGIVFFSIGWLDYRRGKKH